MTKKIPLKFEFEYGAKSCIWDDRVDFYGYPNGVELLKDYGFSEDLVFLCLELAQWYILTINTNSPHDGLYLDPDFIYLFLEMEKVTFAKLTKEQGDKYEITYNQSWLRRDYENDMPSEPVFVQH